MPPKKQKPPGASRLNGQGFFMNALGVMADGFAQPYVKPSP